MTKKILLIPVLITATFFLSGCSVANPVTTTKSTMNNATFIKTINSGTSWEPKMKIDATKNIAGIDVLSMAINPSDQNIIYIGTAKNGLFVTKDAGETWTHIAYPEKAYNLLFNPSDSNIMYGSGVLNGRAKIFKRIGEDQEWKEIYTEPENGTIIASLAINKANANILYAGTSTGVILKTTDAGQTWVNLKKEANISSPIINIVFDSANDQHVFFGVFMIGLLETKNAGMTIENISSKIDTVGRISSLYTLTADPYLGGVVYVGTNAGIFRRAGDGAWSALNLIESSKAFPVRVIAINPKNSKEIMYSVAGAIYKSIDSGTTWSTFQLDAAKEIGVIKYDLMDTAKVYAGLRGF